MRATRVIGLLALGLAPLLFGCDVWYRPGYTPGGSGHSSNIFTYVSTTHLPKTITLVDVRSGEALWAVDVPVGQQVVIRFFDEGEDTGNPQMPSLMRWQLMPSGQRFGPLSNAIPCPPRDARRVDLELRAGPEYAVQQPDE